MPKDGAKKTEKKAPKPSLEKKSVFEQGWMVETPLEANHLFGQSWIMAHVEKDKQVEAGKLLLKEYITNSELDAEAHANIMKKRMSIDHAHVMRLHDWSCHKKSDWCSSYYKFKAFYTNPVTNMRLKIQELKGQPVPHEDLTHIMYQMLFALEYLHTQGQAFNDFRPEYVGKLRQEHSWILCDRLSAPGSALQAQKKNFNDIWAGKAPRRYYAAPEVFAQVTTNAKGAKVDEFLADVWSLGFVLLSAGLGLTIKDHNDLYKLGGKGKPGTVDMAAVNEKVAAFKAQYEKDSNSILGLVVELCMKEVPTERLTMSDLLHHPDFGLPNYEEVISHFNDQNVQGDWERTLPARPPVEVEVGGERPEVIVHHEPVHVRPSHHVEVVTTHETREPQVIHEHLNPEVRVVRREPEVRREYIKLDGSRTSHVDHVDVVHTDVVRDVVHTDVVVREGSRVVRGEPRVISSRVVSHRDGEVVRRSHRAGEHVVRGEPRIIHGESRVIRGEPRVVQGDVVLNHGDHTHHIHQESHVNHGHVVTTTCDHIESTGHHVGSENVRVIRDPTKVAEYKARMEAEGRHFETRPGHSHVVQEDVRYVGGDVHVVRE